MSYHEFGGKPYNLLLYLIPFQGELMKSAMFRGKDWIAGLTDAGRGLYMYLDCPSSLHADVTAHFCVRYNTKEVWDYKAETLYTETVRCEGGEYMKMQYHDIEGKLQEWFSRKNAVFYIWVRITSVIYLRARREVTRASKPDIIHHSEKLSKLLLTQEYRYDKYLELDDDIDPTEVEELSNYISYEKKLTKDNIPKLLRIAHQLECPEVTRACEKFMLENKEEFTWYERDKLAFRYKLYNVQAEIVEEEEEMRRERKRAQEREIEEQQEEERLNPSRKRRRRRR